MMISMIAARSKNGVIGVKNDIPWRIPEDWQYFKETTLGKTVIMGRNTFESMHSKPLPKRFNIVVTRDITRYQEQENLKFVSSLEEAFSLAHNCTKTDEEEVFVIGGQRLYTDALSFAHKIYITEVDLEVENGEVFFPSFDEADWQEVKSEPANNNTHKWTYRVLTRKPA